MNIAIFGYSSLLQRKVLPALAALDMDVSLFIFTRRDAGKFVIQETSICGLRVHFIDRSELKEVANKVDFGLVYISSRNKDHYIDLNEAVSLKAPTIVDKPAFLSAAESREIICLYRRKRLFLEELETWRLHEQVGSFCRHIENLRGNIDVCSIFTVPLFERDNYRVRSETGSGVFHDMNAYLYSTLDLFGLQSEECRIESSKHDGSYCTQWFSARVDADRHRFRGFYGFGFEYSNRLIASDGETVVQLERAYTSSPNEPSSLVTFRKNEQKEEYHTCDAFRLYLSSILNKITSGTLCAESALNRLSSKYTRLAAWHKVHDW